jgi:amino acid adenylation domain-containing protein
MSSSPSESQLNLTAVDFDPFVEGELLLTVPATEAQKEIWASVQLGDDANCAYNESVSLRFRGDLDVENFRAALQALIQRHEALRTTLSPDGTTLCIVENLIIDIPLFDLVELAAPELQANIDRYLKQAVEQPFDLEYGPLFRAQILRLQPQEYFVILTAHHIICDGWSWAVMMPDLGKLYSSFCQGINPDFEIADRFSDYALMLEEAEGSEEMLATEAYWLKQFSGTVPILDLPVDRPRPPLRTFNSTRKDQVIDPGVVDQLKQLSKRLGCSFMTTFLAAFEVFLHRLTGQDDLVVGIPSAGQAATGMTNLVGHCVNLLPLRTRIDPNQAFSEYLRSRRSKVLEAYDYQQFTFGSLVKQLSIPRDPSRIPLVSTIFNIDQALEASNLPFAGLDVEFFSNPRTYENFELSVNATEYKQKFILEWEYNTDLFDHDTACRQIAIFVTLLEGIVANPDQEIAKLPFLPAAEQQLITAWNQTQSDFPSDVCIHELFEAQAERTPDAIAVVFEQKSLTYRELSIESNQLAHYLRSLGVTSDTFVGLCLNRSLEMAIAFLGILKAGGAYLPLDPNYPADRLAFMMQDTQVNVLVTSQALQQRVPTSGLQVVALDQDWEQIAKLSTTCPSRLATPDHLAYIIYTSGSTGVPKGVLIEHRGLVNHCTAIAQKFGLSTADRVMQFASISFDIAVEELFPAWISGATVVFRTDEILASMSDFVQFVAQQKITILDLPTAFWQEWVNQMETLSKPLPACVRLVCVGGEKAARSTYDTWLKHVGASCRWINTYGPTETTVTATLYEPLINPQPDQTLGEIPIGQPIANVQTYVLDRHAQPVPIGVPGELYIGGTGLARAYLNRPDVTAERFIANPFTSDATARLYRTGDLVRYLPDGNLEFLGRTDNQIKIRGFRVELGEIEATLLQHPAVREAAVVTTEDIPGYKSLVGYVTLSSVAGETNSDKSSKQVADWQQRWDLLYQTGVESQADEPNSTLVDDIAILRQLSDRDDFEAEAREWLDQTLARIRNLNPDRVLEIGCGSGQLLTEIAPICSQYVGTDYALLALQALEKHLQTLDRPLPQVTLKHRAADNFQGIEPASFDTIIIHSVIQYFPDAQYLLQVIENALQALKPGGCLYIGDVQSYALLETYHTSDQLKRSPETMTLSTFKDVVSNRIRNEDELVVDPDFFYALKNRISAISHVDVQLRRGHQWNETTQFHYDVFIRIAPQSVTTVEPDWHHWQSEALSIESLGDRLKSEQPDVYCINHIPNARIQKEIQTLVHLQSAKFNTLAELSASLPKTFTGVDPEALWTLGDQLGYDVKVRWSAQATDGEMEAIFTRSLHPPIWVETTVASSKETSHLEIFANSPMLKQTVDPQMIPQLRQFLKEHLPDYMVPTHFMILEAMPLTPSGKLDRKALPTPIVERLDLAEGYVAPRNKAEQTIADVWAQVLRLERVGIHSNFFELGGHSLLATQVIARLRQAFEIELPLRSLFEQPTVAGLSSRIETLKWATQSLQTSHNEATEEYEEGEL